MIRLPEVFSEHMVLQRNKYIAVWGWTTEPAAKAVLNGFEAHAFTDENGHFMIKLPPMKEGGPYVLQVIGGEISEETFIASDDSVVFGDVMIGDVWLAGGQSNMELEIQKSYKGEEILKKLDNKLIRYFYTPKVAFEGKEMDEAKKEASWETADQDHADSGHAGRWSAVAYYFASKVSSETGVTVGIINCNWGGTHAYCWISREYQERNKNISRFIQKYDEDTKDLDMDRYLQSVRDYEEYQAGFDRRCGEYYATHEHPSWDECIKLCGENQYPGPVGPHSFVRPAGLYETIIRQVVPYTLSGFIYYQGEEDDQTPELYYDLLTTLIKQWRDDWKDQSLPFIIVMLPMFKNEGDPDLKNWAKIREAQLNTFRTVRNTGIAVITDMGELNNIHAVHKKAVGERLALQALYMVYGRAGDNQAFGPIYRESLVEGNEMTFIFDHAYDGIVEDRDFSKLTPDMQHYSSFIEHDDMASDQFEIAGADKKFYKADKMEIRGDRITVSSEHVKCPVYGRYMWTNFGKVMLYGATSGIPVAPFRTDQSVD